MARLLLARLRRRLSPHLRFGEHLSRRRCSMTGTIGKSHLQTSVCLCEMLAGDFQRTSTCPRRRVCGARCIASWAGLHHIGTHPGQSDCTSTCWMSHSSTHCIATIATIATRTHGSRCSSGATRCWSGISQSECAMASSCSHWWHAVALPSLGGLLRKSVACSPTRATSLLLWEGMLPLATWIGVASSSTTWAIGRRCHTHGGRQHTRRLLACNALVLVLWPTSQVVCCLCTTWQLAMPSGASQPTHR